MKKGIPDALYEDIKEKYRKIADKRPDITQEKLNELFESEVKYYQEIYETLEKMYEETIDENTQTGNSRSDGQGRQAPR